MKTSHCLPGIVPVLLGLALAATTTPAAAGPAFPSHQTLAAGSWQTRWLPGRQEFTFTLYGCPGDLPTLQSLVTAMKQVQLGNGFDPGPAARAASRPLFEFLASIGWPVVCYPGCPDMQVKGGRCVLTPADAEALESLDHAGVFHAVQLGEWGYYFHNLSHAEGWWHDVYGVDFDRFKHLMKPPGLAGYDARPASRRQCHDILRDYFTSRSRDMLGRIISVTGHSHYEAYAAQWGTRCVGLELGENIGFTQSKIAFARGASRQNGLAWSVQVSPWFAGACTTRGPLRTEGNYARGLEAGHSLSFYRRLWLHAWFAGAAMVTPENSIAIFFEEPAPPWTLTSHGQAAVETFRLMRTHDRGIAYTPVAIVLDRDAGYNGYMGRPWGILEPTAGDLEIRDLLEHQLFPGSDHIHGTPFPDNPEASFLRPTGYGEMFDVLLANASAEVLASYPVLLLAGDLTFDQALVGTLEQALSRGSRLLLNPRHVEAAGEYLPRWRQAGAVEVLEQWINPATGRPAAISHARLAALCRNLLPVTLQGDPVQWQVNRTPRGWVVELVNHQGVVKHPSTPAQIDPAARARVKMTPRFGVAQAREWMTTKTFSPEEDLVVTIPAGGTAFMELMEAP